ncbi:MAG: exodeoxyribonuclease VII small subunit [Peptococcaceae bacterium]|nr:exodeoxyribonuclease VII small subunit [Peptococcaceae bacterium]MDR2736630.1 exodeoxyribonuclease VII small subunit [Gracilibacteraceae bacterium]
MAEASPERETNLSFEEGLKRLEEVLRELEQPAVTLDASLGLFGEGVALIRRCQTQLTQAEGKLQVLMEEADGSLVLRELADLSADLE